MSFRSWCGPDGLGKARETPTGVVLSVDMVVMLPDPEWTGEGPPEEVEVEDTYELPCKYVVCSRCNGKGTHVNPSIDGNGITSSEWAEWDDEEKDHYMSGAYDVSCEECHGLRVVPEVDAERCDPVILKAYEDYVESAYDGYAEEMAERRMGC